MCNVDTTAIQDGLAKTDWSKDKAVRKVVGTIIEVRGGNGAVVKKDLDKDYGR